MPNPSDMQKPTDKLKPSKPTGLSEKARSNVERLTQKLEQHSMGESNADAIASQISEQPRSEPVGKSRQENKIIADAARQGIQEKAGHVIQEEGRAGEKASMARLQNAGEKVDDLNRYQENFPLVDVSTDQRIQSIKVKSVGRPADDSVYDRYRYDFEKLRNAEQAGKAADTLQKHGARLPTELGPNPSRERIASYIQQKGELAIPDDHVAGTRQNIVDMAHRVPGRYGLDAGSPTLEQDIQKLAERVQPIGITSSEIARMGHRSLRADR